MSTTTATRRLSPSKAARGPAAARLQLHLAGNGNPDFAQFAPVADPKKVTVFSLVEASKTARAYISFWNLGGGNWTGDAGKLVDRTTGKVVARVSYNGRVWREDGTEIDRATTLADLLAAPTAPVAGS